MDTVSVRQPRIRLSKLLARVETAEEFVIARGSTPIARLVPLAKSGRRRPGAWIGLVRYGDDLADPLPVEVAIASLGTPSRDSSSS